MPQYTVSGKKRTNSILGITSSNTDGDRFTIFFFTFTISLKVAIKLSLNIPSHLKSHLFYFTCDRFFSFSLCCVYSRPSSWLARRSVTCTSVAVKRRLHRKKFQHRSSLTTGLSTPSSVIRCTPNTFSPSETGPPRLDLFLWTDHKCNKTCNKTYDKT